MRLCSYETEDQLMICFVEAGRIDDVRRLHRVDEVEDGHASRLHAGHVWHDVKLWNLAALHRDRADAGDTIQRRLQLIGRQLPELRLRETVGGEAVAENRERLRRSGDLS